MGVYDVVRRGFIEALTGYREEDLEKLCKHAQLMSNLAMRAKYKDRITAVAVVANVRIIDRLSTILGYPRRKRAVPKVEIVQWGDGGGVASPPDPPADEACPISLLAKITGPSVGAQLDIQRECISRDLPGQELQGEKQIFDVVPPDRVERVQSSPAIQAS